MKRIRLYKNTDALNESKAGDDIPSFQTPPSEFYSKIRETSGNVDDMQINPSDMVFFQNIKMTVQSVMPDGSLVLLSPKGYTIECQKNAVKLVDKVDTVKNNFKIDKKTQELINESQYVACNVSVYGTPMTEGETFVKFGQWYNAGKGKNVRILNNELMEEYDVPADDVTILELPGSETEPDDSIKGINGLDPRWQYGVEIAHDGNPIRKLMIDSVSWSESHDETAPVNVLFITDSGYKKGTVPKSQLSPVLNGGKHETDTTENINSI